MTAYYNAEGKRVITSAEQEDIDAARDLGNRYDPDIMGRFPWDCDSYGDPKEQKRLNLSKASLGIFVEAVLRLGGSITDIYAMNPNYIRSAVLARVHMTVKQKQAFEAETGFLLRKPPTVKLS